MLDAVRLKSDAVPFVITRKNINKGKSAEHTTEAFDFSLLWYKPIIVKMTITEIEKIFNNDPLIGTKLYPNNATIR